MSVPVERIQGRAKDGLGTLGILSPEVRDIIYDLCLVTTKGTTLRAWSEMLETTKSGGSGFKSYRDNNVKFSDVGILRISREVHKQALYIFYSRNKFHYTILYSDVHTNTPIFHRNGAFLTHLSLMRQISLDFREGITSAWRINYKKIGEQLLPEYLRTIEKHCIPRGSRNLSTLDLILISLPNYIGHPSNELLGKGATSDILHKMYPRIGKLTILAIGCGHNTILDPEGSNPYMPLPSQHVLSPLCSEIAPVKEWEKTSSEFWTAITLPYSWLPGNKNPIEEFNRLGRHGDSIHIWTLANYHGSRVITESGGQGETQGLFAGQVVDASLQIEAAWRYHPCLDASQAYWV